MHDPMTVAHTIRRPWPSRPRAVTRGPRWRVRFHHRPWWDPSDYYSHWRIAGREFYWPSLITIWHNEPGGRDSGDVCPHRVRWQDESGKWRSKPLRGWRWHVHHWSIQVHPFQNWRRRLLTRCEECGRKGSPNIGHQWDREKGPWWKGERGLYHRECSSLIHYRRTEEGDKELIRYLVSALRVASDESTEEVVARLTDPRSRGLDFHHAYRLTRVMGYERDDDYNLVPKGRDE